MKRFWKPAAMVLGLVVLAVVIMVFVVGNEQPVTGFRMEETPFTQVISASGRVATTRVVDVKAEIAGRIVIFAVEEGDLVQQGQLLAVVDDSDLQIQLAQFRSSLQAAQARLRSLEETQAPISEETIRQLAANIESQEQVVARQEALYAEGAVPLTDLERARLELTILRSQQNAAQTTLQAQSGGGSQRAETAAGVEQARRQVQALENELTKYRIYAPMTGRVTETELGEGEWTQVGLDLLTLVSEEGFYVEVDLDERLIGLISPGQPAAIWPEAYPSQSVSGSVLRSGRQVDPSTGTVPVRIAIDHPVDYLIKDLTVQAEIEVRDLDRALLLPVRYLFRRDPYQVLVAVGGRVEVRSLRADVAEVTRLLVLEGLSPGDLVLDPEAGLSPGQSLSEQQIMDDPGL